jgi:hypothetical protein
MENRVNDLAVEIIASWTEWDNDDQIRMTELAKDLKNARQQLDAMNKRTCQNCNYWDKTFCSYWESGVTNPEFKCDGWMELPEPIVKESTNGYRQNILEA